MNEKDNGGPVFPGITQGITMRDYFAAKAMQALITAKVQFSGADVVSKSAYAMADEMLQAREA